MKIAAIALLVAASAAVPTLSQSPAIWAVSDDDTTVYLLGTVHALDEGQAWFSGEIATAYNRSTEIVLENDVADRDAARNVGMKYAKSNRRLRDLLPGPKAKALEASLVTAGAKKSALDGYDPWFANIIVGSFAMKGSPLKNFLSVDIALVDKARRDRKALISLETPDEQFSAFDSIPISAQLKHLEASIDEPERVKESAEQIVRCWKIGDLTCVRAASDQEIGAIPEVRDALLVRRNARWAEWVADRMRRPGTVLLAVGVEHFVGDGALPDKLADRGLHTERIGANAPETLTRTSTVAPLSR